MGDKYVTVILDLPPPAHEDGASEVVGHGRGPIEGSVQAVACCLAETVGDGIDVVVMDEFTGFKSAVAEELPDAVPVMDPFQVIRLTGDALGNCRRRIQNDTFGRRDMEGDPLYQARRTLLTGAGLLTDEQQAWLAAVFADERHTEVEATWVSTRT